MRLVLALAGAIVLVARSASASCTTPLTSPCIDSDTLWPHAGPSEFLTVGGTETVEGERVAFGLVGSYLLRPIVIHSPSPAGSDRPAIDNQFDATFLFAYGVTDRLELDLALPITVFQDGAGTSPLVGGGDLPATATRDMRFGLTYALIGLAR